MQSTPIRSNPAVQIDEAEQQGANGGLADDEDEAEGGGDAYMERLARIRERIKVPRRRMSDECCSAGATRCFRNAYSSCDLSLDTGTASLVKLHSAELLKLNICFMRPLHMQAGNHDESDDDSEWTEDEEVSTPVDPVDPFLAFSDAVRHLQSAHPARFQVRLPARPAAGWYSLPLPHVAVSCIYIRNVLPWEASSCKAHPLHATSPCQRRPHDAGAGFGAGSGAGGSRAGAAATC